MKENTKSSILPSWYILNWALKIKASVTVITRISHRYDPGIPRLFGFTDHNLTPLFFMQNQYPQLTMWLSRCALTSDMNRLVANWTAITSIRPDFVYHHCALVWSSDKQNCGIENEQRHLQILLIFYFIYFRWLVALWIPISRLRLLVDTLSITVEKEY